MRQYIDQWSLIFRFVKEIFPQVDHALGKWREYARIIPDEFLGSQALASIGTKRFHCQGGSVYALYPGVDQEVMVRFIVAFQTISDYLDNLCDRAGWEDENSFQKLHLAMIEALSPELPLSDYYALYPFKNDGGYLRSLVEECRSCLSSLPSYRLIQKPAIELVSLYRALQSLKHLNSDRREEKMIGWASPYLKIYPDISVWEFGAATGSTLGVFMLCAASFNPDLTQRDVEKIKKAYFPYICGFHILLDYLIDQAEDRQEGDLNFIFYYHDKSTIKERLSYFLDKSLNQTQALDHPNFHTAIIAGMAALYLSDAKASDQSLKEITGILVKEAGKTCNLWHRMCKYLRKKKVI